MKKDPRAAPPGQSVDDGRVTATPTDGRQTESPPKYPIVGIGASAGERVAFEEFFSALDKESGNEIADGMLVQPGHTSIIPPNRDLAIEAGRIVLLRPSGGGGPRMTIDSFFSSLARPHAPSRAHDSGRPSP